MQTQQRRVYKIGQSAPNISLIVYDVKTEWGRHELGANIKKALITVALFSAR